MQSRESLRPAILTVAVRRQRLRGDICGFNCGHSTEDIEALNVRAVQKVDECPTFGHHLSHAMMHVVDHAHGPWVLRAGCST